MKKKILSLMLVFSLALSAVLPVQASTYQAQQPVKVKKDGTPDKRFKANKEVKGPLTKSGTPDKRFKANKAANVPLTKSGKPDMRHKVNNANAGKKKS